MPYPSYPIVGVKGSARSGKDTIAGFLAEALGGVCIAQADPMKRFAATLFGFTEEQLWGGAAKEAVDPRAAVPGFWSAAESVLMEVAPPTMMFDWGIAPEKAMPYLRAWFASLQASPETFSPRVVLQTFGTEFGRAVEKDVWSRYSLGVAETLLNGGSAYDRSRGLYPYNGTDLTPGWVLVTDVRFRNEALNIKRLGGWILEVINPEAAGPSNVGIKGHASETELATIPKTWTDVRFTNDKKGGLDTARFYVEELVRNLFKVP